MRRTTGSRLQKAIADNLVSVTSAVVNYDERGKEPISIDKISEDSIHIAIGKASCYCYDDIDVTLQLSDGVDMETATKQLYENFDERLSA